MVKRIDAEEKTAGGIIIPDTLPSEKYASQGEITAVGPGGRDEAGKLIPRLTSRLATACCSASGQALRGQASTVGQELLIMKESDIMGVLTDLPAAKQESRVASAPVRLVYLILEEPAQPWRSRRMRPTGSNLIPEETPPSSAAWDRLKTETN